MQTTKRGVILVGHGGIPTDCPRELVMRLKRLEGQRRERGGPLSFEERELDQQIRHWRRTPQTDPYQAGLENLASTLKPLLNGALFATAYNEYCAPALPEAVRGLVQQGASDITVVTTMVTPGGAHAEIEIPELLAQLRKLHAGVAFRYAWPFDLGLVAKMLANHIDRFSPT